MQPMCTVQNSQDTPAAAARCAAFCDQYTRDLEAAMDLSTLGITV